MNDPVDEEDAEPLTQLVGVQQIALDPAELGFATLQRVHPFEDWHRWNC